MGSLKWPDDMLESPIFTELLSDKSLKVKKLQVKESANFQDDIVYEDSLNYSSSLSTSALAKKYSINQKILYDYFIEIGWTERRGDERKLTELGIEKGGQYRTLNGKNFWIVWPDNLLEDYTFKKIIPENSFEQNGATYDSSEDDEIEDDFDMHYELDGNWRTGWALDLHTIKSIPLGGGYFDTTYTDIGLSLNRLKYHQDYSQIDVLADAVISFLKTRKVTPYLNVIIPTPASVIRNIQPVEAIAIKISKALNIPIDNNYLFKHKDTSQLKGIDDQTEREKILDGVFDVHDLRYKNKKILLFDDLFRSGSTLKEITKTLYNKGKVKNVYVVTLTKTRTKK
jgi:competence protein ComFC